MAVYKICMAWSNGYAPDQVTRITWGELKEMMDGMYVEDDDEIVVDLGGKYGANYYGIDSVDSCEMENGADEKLHKFDQARSEFDSTVQQLLIDRGYGYTETLNYVADVYKRIVDTHYTPGKYHQLVQAKDAADEIEAMICGSSENYKSSMLKKKESLTRKKTESVTTDEFRSSASRKSHSKDRYVCSRGNKVC